MEQPERMMRDNWNELASHSGKSSNTSFCFTGFTLRADSRLVRERRSHEKVAQQTPPQTHSSPLTSLTCVSLR